MQEHDEVFGKETTYEEQFRLLAERESLARNLVALRRIAWDLRAKIYQLEKASEEMKDLRADILSLQAQIDATAENLGQQPIANKWG